MRKLIKPAVWRYYDIMHQFYTGKPPIS